MKVHVRDLLTAFTILVLLILLLGSPTFSAEASLASNNRVAVAMVNEVPVYLDQLEPLLKAEAGKYSRFAGGQTAEKLEAQLQKKALGTFIDTELLYQQALKMDFPEAEALRGERFEQLKTYYSSRHAEEKPEQRLQEMASRDVYVKEYLQRQGVTDPEIKEEEIKAFHEAAKAQFARKESVHVRHIIVQLESEDSEEELKKARNRIQKARQLIVDGRTFEEVAKEYSEDNAAEAGGDIGFVKRGYMPSEFENLAFSIEPETLSEPVRTAYGYHILEVLEKVPGGTLPYPEVRDFLLKYLKEQKSRKTYVELLAELKKQADIQILFD